MSTNAGTGGIAPEQWSASWPKVVAKAWLDPAFRDQLLANPASVLTSQYNWAIPQGLTLYVAAGEGAATAPVNGPAPVLVLRLPDAPTDLQVDTVSSVANHPGAPPHSVGPCPHTIPCCC